MICKIGRNYRISSTRKGAVFIFHNAINATKIRRSYYSQWEMSRNCLTLLRFKQLQQVELCGDQCRSRRIGRSAIRFADSTLRKLRTQRDYLPPFYSLSHFPTFFESYAELATAKHSDLKSNTMMIHREISMSIQRNILISNSCVNKIKIYCSYCSQILKVMFHNKIYFLT